MSDAVSMDNVRLVGELMRSDAEVDRLRKANDKLFSTLVSAMGYVSLDDEAIWNRYVEAAKAHGKITTPGEKSPSR